MGHVISVTLSQGSNLMRLLHTPGWKIGKEVGEKKFTDNIASNCNKRMHLFYKLLRKNSPILRDEDKVHFGPREEYETWERKPLKLEIEAGENPEKDITIYEILDLKRTVDLDLTGKERDGLYWTLFLSCHPASPYCQGPAGQDMLVWPLVEQIGMTGQLEEDIGVSKGQVQELVDDSERAKKEADAQKEKDAAKVVKEAKDEVEKQKGP